MLGDRLNAVARAADEVASGLRARLAPDQVQIEFSVKIAAEVNWWFFSKTQGEGAIAVTLAWDKSKEAGEPGGN